jgi:uncharacterized protein YdeI (BOF family)
MGLRRMARKGVLTIGATVACLVGLMAGTALAAVVDIGNITSNPGAYKDQVVSVSGTIDQMVEGNEYILKDATGSIKIDGGPAWFKSLGLTVGQAFSITGEVDLGKDGTAVPEIDIFTVADQTGATVATVREGSGRPPWAGGPNKNGQLLGNAGNGAADDDDSTPEAPEAPDLD